MSLATALQRSAAEEASAPSAVYRLPRLWKLVRHLQRGQLLSRLGWQQQHQTGSPSFANSSCVTPRACNSCSRCAFFFVLRRFPYRSLRSWWQLPFRPQRARSRRQLAPDQPHLWGHPHLTLLYGTLLVNLFTHITST